MYIFKKRTKVEENVVVVQAGNEMIRKLIIAHQQKM